MRQAQSDQEPSWEGAFELLDQSPMALRLWDGIGTIGTAKWVPKSQVISVSKTEKQGVVIVTMKEWIARKKGFI